MGNDIQIVVGKIPKFIFPIITLTNWSGFTNQPAGDGVEVLSSSASDTQVCTVWGTDTSGTLRYEQITLNGTTAVSSTRVNWQDIVSVILAEYDGSSVTPAVGTVTVREASGNAAITTITAGNIHSGMLIVDCQHEDIEINISYGNVYFSNLSNIPTATTGLKIKGAYSARYKNTQYSTKLISDDVGASIQLVIFEN